MLNHSLEEEGLEMVSFNGRIGVEIAGQGQF
jgi:hypothetical protein